MLVLGHRNNNVQFLFWFALTAILHCKYCVSGVDGKRLVQSSMFRSRIGRMGNMGMGMYNYNSEYTTSSYRYANGYAVSPELVKRKGGIGANKATLILAGKVFVALHLRRLLSSGGVFNSNLNYDLYGVCEGHMVGLNMANHSQSFSYFMCPTDETQAEQVARSPGLTGDVFCCRSSPSQYCCSQDTFYQMNGKVAAAVNVIVIVAGIIGFLVFAGCVGLLICAYLVMSKKKLFKGSTSRVNGASTRPVSPGSPASNYAASTSPMPYPVSPLAGQPAYPQQQGSYPVNPLSPQPAYPQQQGSYPVNPLSPQPAYPQQQGSYPVVPNYPQQQTPSSYAPYGQTPQPPPYPIQSNQPANPDSKGPGY